MKKKPSLIPTYQPWWAPAGTKFYIYKDEFYFKEKHGDWYHVPNMTSGKIRDRISRALRDEIAQAIADSVTFCRRSQRPLRLQKRAEAAYYKRRAKRTKWKLEIRPSECGWKDYIDQTGRRVIRDTFQEIQNYAHMRGLIFGYRAVEIGLEEADFWHDRGPNIQQLPKVETEDRRAISRVIRLLCGLQDRRRGE